ncbi:MAG: hypothetical protein ABIG95_03585 [Candidatus Woesearchaeota archaeon]
MPKKEVEKRLSTGGWVIIIVVVLILISFIVYNKSVVKEEIAKQEKSQELERQLEEFKGYTKEYVNLKERALQHQMAINDSARLGDFWANNARTAYNNGSWTTCISSCIKSRSYYSETTTEANTAKALWERIEGLLLNEIMPRAEELLLNEFDQSGFEGELRLVEYMIVMSNTTVHISYANYEACEYQEAACENYGQGDYEGGDWAIQNLNQAIAERDRLVKIQNEYRGKMAAQLP